MVVKGWAKKFLQMAEIQVNQSFQPFRAGGRGEPAALGQCCARPINTKRPLCQGCGQNFLGRFWGLRGASADFGARAGQHQRVLFSPGGGERGQPAGLGQGDARPNNTKRPFCQGADKTFWGASGVFGALLGISGREPVKIGGAGEWT